MCKIVRVYMIMYILHELTNIHVHVHLVIIYGLAPEINVCKVQKFYIHCIQKYIVLLLFLGFIHAPYILFDLDV